MLNLVHEKIKLNEIFNPCSKNVRKKHNFHKDVAFSINLCTKGVFLVMCRPPLPPCTDLYKFVLTPPPPLDAYVINGRPPTYSSYTWPY